MYYYVCVVGNGYRKWELNLTLECQILVWIEVERSICHVVCKWLSRCWTILELFICSYLHTCFVCLDEFILFSNLVGAHRIRIFFLLLLMWPPLINLLISLQEVLLLLNCNLTVSLDQQMLHLHVRFLFS